VSLVKKKKNYKQVGIILGGLGIFVAHNWLAIDNVVINRGISFGWLGSLPGWMMVGILGGLLIGLLTTANNSPGWCLIIIGGAVNLLDRIKFGGVRDYWKLGLGIYNNLNDWIIAIGVVWLLIGLWNQQLKLSIKKTA